jgi:hypothetical protein
MWLLLNFLMAFTSKAAQNNSHVVSNLMVFTLLHKNLIHIVKNMHLDIPIVLCNVITSI